MTVPNDPNIKFLYSREYWSGDSRDGLVVNGDGYHFFQMDPSGLIIEAFEVYETDEGDEVVTPLPEMHGVHWINDLGFEDFEALDIITERDYLRIKSIRNEPQTLGR